MKIFYSSKKFPASTKNPFVALGNFDGVHRAHQRMFQITNRLAKKNMGNSVVYTFDPHPVKVLSKNSAPPMINTPEQKIELIQKSKIDVLILEPFLLSFAHLEARDWFKKIIVKKLHAKGVVAGYDFTFGTHRSGTVETLHELCSEFGILCHILEAQLHEETLISSTQIRQFVLHGEMKEAANLLGRPYFMDGEVVQGMGRGATLGIRTANLMVQNKLIPHTGVYACNVQVAKRRYKAVTNIGINPTFGGQALGVETHLLNFNRDIYGKTIRVFFEEKIRDEQTFTSPEELIQQIKLDIKLARAILSR